MPSKISPNDWDHFFSASGPRRSGPLGTLVKSVLVLGVAGGLVYGLNVFNKQLEANEVARNATLEAYAPTATALAFQRTQQQTAEAAPTPTQPLPTGRVILQSPLRTVPGDDSPVVAEVYANSNVQYAEEQVVNEVRWWRIIVIDQSSPNSAAPGTSGWVPSTSLTEPSAPLPQAEAPPPQLPPVTLAANTLEVKRDPASNISVPADARWQPQSVPTLGLGTFFAPSLDASEGVAAAKILDLSRDANGYQLAAVRVAEALGVPGSAPQVTVTSSSDQMASGTVTWQRIVGGQTYQMQGRFMAQAAPGNSVGVVVAFVPENSFGANDAVLTQITQGVIFQ